MCGNTVPGQGAPLRPDQLQEQGSAHAQRASGKKKTHKKIGDIRREERESMREGRKKSFVRGGPGGSKHPPIYTHTHTHTHRHPTAKLKVEARGIQAAEVARQEHW